MEEEKKEFAADDKRLLVPTEKYLKSGVHIGTRFKSGDMRHYIFKQRSDNLKVLDINTLDQRIRNAAAFISGFELSRVVIVSKKLYAQTSAKVFAEAIGGKAIVGRFVPGIFTNPQAKGFLEPKLLIAAEPDSDAQAISEATRIKIPVIALCSTNNSTQNVDLVIPVNNKGRKSLALVFWLLAREVLKNTGAIKSDSEFKKEVEAFEYKLPEGAAAREEDFEERFKRQRFQRGRQQGGRQRTGRGFGDRSRQRRR